MLIIFIYLLCAALYSDAYYPRSLFHIMFDNITIMDDIGFFDDDTESPDSDEQPVTNKTLEELLSEPNGMNVDLNSYLESFKQPLGEAGGHDYKHFNELNFEVYNFTRKRMRPESFQYNSYYDLTENGKMHTQERENFKMMKLRMIGLEYLIISRYKIASAMDQRSKVRKDKRYQLGYLFCRLRRIKTEMLKLIVMAYEQFNIWWQRRMITLMRIYQEVIRMEVDIRDTIQYIIEVSKRYSPHDFQSPFLPEQFEKSDMTLLHPIKSRPENANPKI